MSREQPSPWQPEQDKVRLAVLGKILEECGEAATIAARCVIQGLEESEPETGKLNCDALEEECADAIAAIEVAIDALSLDNDKIQSRVRRKILHLRGWHELLMKLNP